MFLLTVKTSAAALHVVLNWLNGENNNNDIGSLSKSKSTLPLQQKNTQDSCGENAADISSVEPELVNSIRNNELSRQPKEKRIKESVGLEHHPLADLEVYKSVEIDCMESTTAFFLRPKQSLGTNKGTISINERWHDKDSLLQRVMIKYMNELDLLPLLVHLHTLTGIRCLVLDSLSDIATSSESQQEAVALALNIPNIELVVITNPRGDLALNIPFGVQSANITV